MAKDKETIFKRKIYDSLLKFKSWNGKRALMIEGARRVGKSTIVEEFAKKEYESYILVDFQQDGEKATLPFEEFPNLDAFFGLLSYQYKVTLHPRKSLIIFDEVQKFPRARECIKQFVADGRYDYIETGSLISIESEAKKIQLPSEERQISMYPLDFEEFLWAMGKDLSFAKECYAKGKGVGEGLHRALMKDYRLYLAIGGMPQAIEAYLDTHNFTEVDEAKMDVITLYRNDMDRIDQEKGYRAKVVFDHILPNLLSHGKTFRGSEIYSKSDAEGARNTFGAVRDSKVANFSMLTSEITPSPAMATLNNDFKIYLSDTGLLLTMALRSGEHPLGEDIYRAVVYDRLSINMGFIIENAIAQALKAAGHDLYYYSWRDESTHKTYEIDFFLPKGKKVNLIEVKSGDFNFHASLDRASQKFSNHVGEKIIICSKDYQRKGDITYLPFYMTGLL